MTKLDEIALRVAEEIPMEERFSVQTICAYACKALLAELSKDEPVGYEFEDGTLVRAEFLQYFADKTGQKVKPLFTRPIPANTAEIEQLKGKQNVQLGVHPDNSGTEQQRELDGSLEMGQLLADSQNSQTSNSAPKRTEFLTWSHTGNGYISDSSGKFIGAFSGDFRDRDRLICAVNSENQFRQQLTEQAAHIERLREALEFENESRTAMRNAPLVTTIDALSIPTSADIICPECQHTFQQY